MSKRDLEHWLKTAVISLHSQDTHLFFSVSGQDQKFNGKPQPGIYETHSNFLVTPLTAWLKREYLSHVKLDPAHCVTAIRYSDFALKYVDEKEIVKKKLGSSSRSSKSCGQVIVVLLVLYVEHRETNV